MLVDLERVLLDLKEFVVTKSHHGQRELLQVIAQLEVQHRMDETLPERALRLYGLQFFEEVVKRPGSERACVSASDGYQVRALRGDSVPESEEDTNGSTGSAGSAVSRDRRGTAGSAAAGARASSVAGVAV